MRRDLLGLAEGEGRDGLDVLRPPRDGQCVFVCEREGEREIMRREGEGGMEGERALPA